MLVPASRRPAAKHPLMLEGAGSFIIFRGEMSLQIREALGVLFAFHFCGIF
jgi:hypothetical protein